jgi:hypothetical protein
MKSLPGSWVGRGAAWEWIKHSSSTNIEGSWEKGVSWSGAPYGINAAKELKNMLSQQHYVIVLVQSEIINGYDRVITSEKVGHWVLITGFSQQWSNGDEESAWNWVRINNPYNNREEYYPWKDSKLSLAIDGYSIVELWQGE